MQRGSTTEQGRSSRDAILDAAVVEFTTKGYRSSSLKGTADQAGITKSGLLHHFDSKEALLAAVLDERTAPTRSAQPAQETEATFETLREVVEHNQHETSWVRFFTIMVAESFTGGHPASPVLRKRYARTRETLATRLRSDYPAASPELVENVVAAAIAIMDGLQVLRLMEEDFDMRAPFELFARTMISELEKNN
jgi:AcrR family transcriptional regulator